MPSTTSQSNFIFDDRMYRTSNNFDTFPYIDQGLPPMSPINPNAKLYPTSTRNYFNIDLLNEGNYQIPLTMQNYNIFRQTGGMGVPSTGYITSPNNYDMAGLAMAPLQQQNMALTPNKEITLHNKILINESDLIGIQNYNLTRNSNYQYLEASKKEEYKNDIKNMNITTVSASSNIASGNHNANNLIDYSEIQMHKRKSAAINKKPSLDLTMINENEVGKIFKRSLVRKESDLSVNIPVNASVEDNLVTSSNYQSVAIKSEENQEKIDRTQEIEDINKSSQSINNNLHEENKPVESKSSPNELNEYNQTMQMHESDQFNSHEDREDNQEQSIDEGKNIETISVTNTSVKSGSEDNINTNLINESNVNRFDLINICKPSNVINDNNVNKSPSDISKLTTQQLQFSQKTDNKAMLNISPKSAFVKMK
jgi:hypothetical protein